MRRVQISSPKKLYKLRNAVAGLTSPALRAGK
ncbi:MAG: hypothetical protein BAJATHORv1_10492 [Candidatus Thorarchaeota archaeon]|nr:MAG: hypothetical protein BAJATHORv1_10492 [Candidatus Thorarchaeota archaeon]